jgi:predicted site-specific integrase-resolvase
MMHEGLGFHKVCSRWVPRQLTPQHKNQRMGLSLQHLQRYQDKGDDTLSRIVTLSSQNIIFRENAFLTMMRLKEQRARGSSSNQKNFTPQVSRDL